VFPEEGTLKRHEGDVANTFMLGALRWRVAISRFYRRKSNNTNGYLRMRQNYSATQTEGLAVFIECPFPKWFYGLRIPWPPRSPDLSPLDLCVKYEVFPPDVTSLQELKGTLWGIRVTMATAVLQVGCIPRQRWGS
jgi:hypothetical protein